MKQWIIENQTALILSCAILVSATGLGALREYGNSQQLIVAEAKLSAAQSSLALKVAENASKNAAGASVPLECPSVQSGGTRSDRTAKRSRSSSEAMEASAAAAAAGAEAAAEGAAAAAEGAAAAAGTDF